MVTDQSIVKRNQQEDESYLDDLAFAVCVNGESLEKYKKIVEKQYGTDAYANMSQFVQTLQQQVERGQFTNTSLLNLKYLGKNAGMSEEAIDLIIDHFNLERKHENKVSVKEIMVCLISAIVLYVVAYSIRDNYENLGPFLCLVSYFSYMLFAFEVVSNKKLKLAICITGWFVMMFFWSDYATQPTQSILPALGILGICSFFALVAYLLLYREEK